MSHELLKNIRAGRLIRRFLGDRYELFILWLFLGSAISVPIGGIIFAIVLTGGHHTIFTLTQTFASPSLHFVPGPVGRGTLNLISVCMSTIFTCVYVSVHGDVPDTSKAEAFAKTLKSYKVPRLIVSFIRKVYTFIEKPTCKRVLFMLFNVVAPEIVVLVSILELFSAYDGRRFMRNMCKQKKWSMTLAFFADMGGFELDDEDHTHFKNGREFLQWFEGRWREYGGDLELDAKRIKREIEDRSKANIVLKIATFIQAAWLFVVTLARFAQKKAVSELEVATCAYIFCTAFTYLFWMSKPYNVETRVVLRESLFLPRSLSSKERKVKEKTLANGIPTLAYEEPAGEIVGGARQLADEAVGKGEEAVVTVTRPGLTARGSSHFRFSSESSSLSRADDSNLPPVPLPIMIYPNARFSPFNRAYLHPEISWLVACVVSGTAGALAGVIHAAPFWNTHFVISTGQWLWRASCIVQVTLPVLISLVALVEWIYTGGPVVFAAMFMALAYGVARIILFALIILSFWSLPDGVYHDVDWAWSEFPHWH